MRKFRSPSSYPSALGRFDSLGWPIDQHLALKNSSVRGIDSVSEFILHSLDIVGWVIKLDKRKQEDTRNTTAAIVIVRSQFPTLDLPLISPHVC